MKREIVLVVLTLSLFGGADRHSFGSSPPEKPQTFCVCLDPGHPSEKNDGMGLTNGLREVTVNWQVALLLQGELEKDGVQVVMTKSSEQEFVPNERRAATANEKHADLFLRLHADAGDSSGFTIYYPRKAGSIRGTTGPSPDVRQKSEAAAKLFHQSFADALRGQLKDNGLRGDEQSFIGSKQGALTGSIFSKVPTVLVEMVFLTNPADAAWIKQASNQAIMAQALAAGVRAVRNSVPRP